MKTIKRKYYLLFIISFVLVMFNSCNDDGFAREIPNEDNLKNVQLPEVTINEVVEENISGNSAEIESFIVSNGGARITKSGICWSTNSEPLIDQDNFTSNGPTIGKIPGFITELDFSTRYYVRSYAINSKGITYSEVISFTTNPASVQNDFKDNFDREALGPQWSVYKGDFGIVENSLRSKSNGHLLFENENAITSSGDGQSFVLETDIRINTTSGFIFAGVIFNAQNENEFYVLRINGEGLLQFLATSDGGVSWPGVFVSTNTNLVGNNLYHLKITSNSRGEINVKFTKGEQVVFNDNFIDPEARYNDGFAGYYSEGEYSHYDNFSLLLDADSLPIQNDFKFNFDTETLDPLWTVYTGDFEVVENVLAATSKGYLLYENEDAITIAGEGHSFIFETDIYLTTNEGWHFAGAIFNAQNENEFYLIRFNGEGLLQFLATSDGGVSWPGVFVITNTNLSGNNVYHLKIMSNTPGEFNVKFTKGEQIVFEDLFIDPEARYNSGYCGYYSEGAVSYFDNFSLFVE